MTNVENSTVVLALDLIMEGLLEMIDEAKKDPDTHQNLLSAGFADMEMGVRQIKKAIE